MAKLIANTDFRYAGKPLKAGEEFEAVSERHALVLIASRRARQAPVETERPRRAMRYGTRQIRAD